MAERAPDAIGLDVRACKEALLRSPAPELMLRTGDAFFGAKREVDAIRLILEVTSSRLDDWRLSLAGAMTLLNHTSRYDMAETLLRNALRSQPGHIPTQAYLAHVRMAMGDIAGGKALFSQMMQRYPAERALVCTYMSVSLLAFGFPMESLEILLPCLQNGQMTAEIASNIGCSLEHLNRSADSLSWYEQALALEPMCALTQFNYACALLKAGRLREGWRRFFDRQLTVADRGAWYLSLPRLRPDDNVAGRRVILFQEQGLGDTLQFIRFVPDLLAKGAEVTILVPQTLVRLLAQSYPAAIVREIGGFQQDDGYAYAAAIPDLPYIGGAMSLREIPAPVSYLRADSDDIVRFAAQLPERRPRIGLVWAGEPRVRSADALVDRRRSTTLAALGAALTPVEATLVSLQFGGPRGEIAQWTGQALCDPMGAVRDMADTAAIVASLDLVISVDTSPVHLAGALGCPVWMISRQDACWRWGDSGERSPWYPGMRLFRAQERSLAPVLRDVGTALRSWVESWRPS